MANLFDDFPENSRLWIFPLAEEVNAEAALQIEQQLRLFLESWTAHQVPVRGDACLKYNRFLLFVADPRSAEVSGCSMDSLARAVGQLAEKVGNRIADYGEVFYKHGGRFVSVGRTEFEELIALGKIQPETLVLDNSITVLGKLRDSAWELPYRESWHQKVFGEILPV